MLPESRIRSAQLSLLPYFFFTGHSRRRALSRLPLSGQEFSGAKRMLPPAAATAIGEAVGPGGVPGEADHQAAVMAVIGRPPVLALGHQRLDVGLHGLEVEVLTASR
jgi:hypothetical protein